MSYTLCSMEKYKELDYDPDPRQKPINPDPEHGFDMSKREVQPARNKFYPRGNLTAKHQAIKTLFFRGPF
jgi:hypothetical protein